jgi:hypothetical protein
MCAAVIGFSISVEADNIPRVVEKIARCGAFMADFPSEDYKDYVLYDVREYDGQEGLFYVVMFCEAGIKEMFVFSKKEGKTEVVWRDMYILPKTVREKWMRECVTLPCAVRIAQAVEAAKKEAAGP